MRATVPLLYPLGVNWEDVILSQMEKSAGMQDEIMQDADRLCRNADLFAPRAQALGHHESRRHGAGGFDVEFVHERAHEKNSAAGTFQKIFVGERIGNVLQAETIALVLHADD